MNKKTSSEDKKLKKLFIISVSMVLFLAILFAISSAFGTYGNISLRKNNKKIFSSSDLTVGKLKFYDDEETVKEYLGKPLKEKAYDKEIYKYKLLEYKGLKLTLKENYDDYILVGAEITSKRYKTSRNIKVNKKITKAIKKYKVQNQKGTYIYGNYDIGALTDKSIEDNVYLAIRNDDSVVYINKDASNGSMTNIARLTFSYKNGKITKIKWSYDIE